MFFQEPEVEFVKLDVTQIVTASGQETHMCGGTSYQPDEDECSTDPSMF
jgi:hypothetical protein